MRKSLHCGGGVRTCKYCKTKVFGSRIHRCDEMDRAIGRPTAREEVELRRIKRGQRKADKEAQEMYDKVCLTKQVLKTTKDFGAEEPLTGYDLILSKFKETASDIWNLDDFVDYLKQNYKTPKKM